MPVQAVPVYAAAPAAKQQRDPAESASRGFALGITGAALSVGGFLVTLVGGSVAALNWMLFIGLLLVLAAIIIGIIGVVFSASGLTRATDPATKQRAGIGLAGSIIGILAFFFLLLGSALASAIS